LRLLRLRGKAKVSTDTNKGNTMTEISIHNATNIKTNGVQHENKNAIVLTVSTDSMYGNLPNAITIFGLPTDIANALEDMFGKVRTRTMTEAEIRADERRKITRQVMHITDPAF
jgi:hypothetical protein